MFFGTPAWAVPSLDAFVASTDFDVARVVTNPDKAVGRKGAVTAPPIKRRALEQGLDVWQPTSVRDASFHGAVRAVEADVAIVVAYGKILPLDLLEIPRLGFVNLHFSLLPAYRGAAPVQRALMNGESVTGVSVMVLTEGMDEGPVLARWHTKVHPDETAGALGERLAVAGAPVLVDAVGGYARGDIEPEPQDHARATYAPKVSSQEARIEWSAPAATVRNLVRATNPEPGAWTTLRGERVKVFTVAERPGPNLEPGCLSPAGGLLCGTGSSAVELVEAQRAGGRRMTGLELARGLRLNPGDCFL